MAEVARCRDDFWHFCTTWLKVPTKPDPVTSQRSLVLLNPSPQQRKVVEVNRRNPRTYVLKARQLGISSIVSAERFWWVHFHPHEVHGVLAHKNESAETIFQIYRKFYDHLPSFLRFPLDRSTGRTLQWRHGSAIKVSSAESDILAGSSLSSVHFSEFARYKKPEELMAAVMGGLSSGAKVTYETTALGFGVGFEYWYADNHIAKVFLPWTDQPEYRIFADVGRIEPRVEQYAVKHGLDLAQKRWMQWTLWTVYNGNVKLFHQDFPATPELAFVSSGDRFFAVNFPGVAKPAAGRIVYEEPKPASTYCIGVDTAAGTEKGDYSSYVVIDCADKSRPRIAATWYGKLLPSHFAGIVLDEARKYKALAVVESNSYGLSVVEALLAAGYAKQFKTVTHDKASDRITERLGWSTTDRSRQVLMNLLSRFVDDGQFDVCDDRLKWEVNGFEANEDGSRFESKAGFHDDMLFALALALAGMAQCVTMADRPHRNRPVTFGEQVAWLKQTGRQPGPQDRFDDDRDDRGSGSVLTSLDSSAPR